ncbi:hypothetical protein H5410_003006 [Solanum commersonii]|uniref:Uncharacterized protein n=1 Tax=Solanum commersonii TaxID=4109 RepID=A0A9J6B3K5_SOLCO|nr:hypothetical protein H5410_003006 [Solanum commersonii]
MPPVQGPCLLGWSVKGTTAHGGACGPLTVTLPSLETSLQAKGSPRDLPWSVVKPTGCGDGCGPLGSSLASRHDLPQI